MSSRKPVLAAAPERTPGALEEQVERLYRLVDEVITRDGLDAIDAETVQRLATLSVKLYAARRAQGADFLPFRGESVNATEVSVMTMGMLKAVNLDLFELSLWRHWGRA